MNKAVKITNGIYRLGANIENGDLFEGLWPIPDGVSLNCYIVKGEKIALIDLVKDWDNAPSSITKQLASIPVKPQDIDYLVLNHIEPDHTGWIEEFLKQSPAIQLVTNKKGAALIESFYGITENVKIIDSGDTINLGNNKELFFENIPNVHWPETMVTFEKESGILFSCDAFGSYGSIHNSVFDDEISEEEHNLFDVESLRYYANIVGSFSKFVLRAIEKLSAFDITVIAPSHGIIWRENPGEIIERYKKFAGYLEGPAEPEITIIWSSMYGHTEKILHSVIKGIRSESVSVNIHQVPNQDVSWALASAWKSRGLVFGMPTYEYKMFPAIKAVIDMFDLKHIYNKKVFRFGSFGWSGGAQKDFEASTEGLKWDFIEPLEWKGKADEEVHKLAFERGRELAQIIKAQ
ncbi:MAG: FprA family A-type flavoprotein [Spirochaetaceae bacterium]|nr:FprA family A-type flavoprotein [Spirochaetaceae bacterium]